MKFNWIVIFLLGASTNISSQVLLDTKSQQVIFEHEQRSSINDSNNQIINLSDTKGSPYFNEKFSSGIVKDEESGESLGYQMRYNIYNDEIEVKNSEDNSIVSIRKSSRYSCKILNDTFKYLGYFTEDKDAENGYFQELAKDKVSLLLKYECKYQPEKIGKPPVFKVTPAKFITQKSYYLLSEDLLTLISTKKKKFLANFGDHKAKVNTYISSNKLKLNSDRDLIRVITYYNSLLK